MVKFGVHIPCSLGEINEKVSNKLESVVNETIDIVWLLRVFRGLFMIKTGVKRIYLLYTSKNTKSIHSILKYVQEVG